MSNETDLLSDLEKESAAENEAAELELIECRAKVAKINDELKGEQC